MTAYDDLKLGPRPSAEHFLRVQEAPIWRDLHADMVRQIAGETSGRALDVGCGPGLLCGQLLDAGWDVTGVDSELDMIDAAITRYPRARFIQDDARSLSSLGDAEFDLVTSSNLLFFLSDPLLACRSMARVCAPGKIVAMLNPAPDLSLDRAALVSAARGAANWDIAVLSNWARLRELNGTFDKQMADAILRLAGLIEVNVVPAGPYGIGLLAWGRTPDVELRSQ